MGMFVTCTGVVGASDTEIWDGLSKLAQAQGGSFEPTEQGSEDPRRVGLSPSRNGCVVSYHNPSRSPLGLILTVAESLKTPAFEFHIHDGDLWTYTLYEMGKPVDHFNPLPDYWTEVSEAEMERCRGDAAKVARAVPGVDASLIAPYLVPWPAWDSEQRLPKAHPEDRYAPGSDSALQMSDFMHRLGFCFPYDDEGRLLGSAFLLTMDEPRTKRINPFTGAPMDA